MNRVIANVVPVAQRALLYPAVVFKEFADIKVGSRRACRDSQAVVLNKTVSGKPGADASGKRAWSIGCKLNVAVSAVIEDGSTDPLAIAVEYSNRFEWLNKSASKPLARPFGNRC